MNTLDKTDMVTSKVSHYDLECLLITAVEGGSNYWAQFSKRCLPKGEYLYDLYEVCRECPEFQVDVFEQGTTDQLGIVDLNRLLKGLEIMMRDYPWHYANVIEDNADAETADVYFQCVVMGEIVFG
jgi:hypothetical protein